MDKIRPTEESVDWSLNHTCRYRIDTGFRCFKTYSYMTPLSISSCSFSILGYIPLPCSQHTQLRRFKLFLHCYGSPKTELFMSAQQALHQPFSQYSDPPAPLSVSSKPTGLAIPKQCTCRLQKLTILAPPPPLELIYPPFLPKPTLAPHPPGFNPATHQYGQDVSTTGAHTPSSFPTRLAVLQV